MNKRFTEGIGEAVAKRTILREKIHGYWETWDDVANRVAQGNSLLSRGDLDEYRALYKELKEGRILMSGRHLQHGDDDQIYKTIEVFTNCSTADFSALSFYLKLNGSGVGRLYNRDCLYVDWGSRPRVFVHLDSNHSDTFAEECTKSKGGLWSANHSICVDAEFWKQESPLAQEVFRQATEASYRGGPEGLGKGEPGFINYDKLKGNVNA